MKEFVEKLISRLEEELKLADEVKEKCARENPLMFDNAKGYATGISNAKYIVNQLAKEYNKKYEPTIDLIEYGIDGYNHHLKEHYRKGYEDAKKENDWIPCSERLPGEELEKAREEKGKEAVFPVLATINKVHPSSGEKYKIVSRAFYGCYNDKNFYNACCDKLNVIAWKPLDAPYEPKGEQPCL